VPVRPGRLPGESSGRSANHASNSGRLSPAPPVGHARCCRLLLLPPPLLCGRCLAERPSSSRVSEFVIETTGWPACVTGQLIRSTQAEPVWLRIEPSAHAHSLTPIICGPFTLSRAAGEQPPHRLVPARRRFSRMIPRPELPEGATALADASVRDGHSPSICSPRRPDSAPGSHCRHRPPSSAYPFGNLRGAPARSSRLIATYQRGYCIGSLALSLARPFERHANAQPVPSDMGRDEITQ
jgi:hypothetical protein